jgi:ABC-type antimicrobial peptide transport system permease subunit
MGVRLERGRIFTDADRLGAPSVAIVYDVAARRFFAGSDPVGQVVTFAGPTTIVGVVSGTHVQGPEAAVQPELYVPLSQRLPVEGGAYGDLVIRVATLTPDVQARVSAAIAPVLQGGKSSEAMSIDTLFEKLTAQRRFTASVLSVFGLVAAVIAAIGIYGVIAFLVSQQTREIGLRMALGASSQSVLMAVLGRAARYVAIGVVIGLAGAWAMSGLFTSLVFGVTPTDPRVYLSAAAFLLVVALVAALAPARRAARIDPLVALRAD